MVVLGMVNLLPLLFGFFFDLRRGKSSSSEVHGHESQTSIGA